MSTEVSHINGSDLAAVSGGQQDFGWLSGFTDAVGSLGGTAATIIGALNKPQTPVQTTPGASTGSDANLPAGVNTSTAGKSAVPVLAIAGIGAVGLVLAVIVLSKRK